MALKPKATEKFSKAKETLATLNTKTGVKRGFHFEYWASDWSESAKWWDKNSKDSESWELDTTEALPSENHMEKVFQLAALRRASANFVRILTNDPHIEVVYSSGKQSKTDGKRVIISAESKPEKFDRVVGLALHEAAHCLLSDMQFWELFQKNFMYPMVWKELHSILPDLTFDDIKNDAIAVLNVLEDRRIDDFVYRTAVGYRPYYTAMYDGDINLPEITKALQFHEAWKVQTREAYFARLINMSNPKAYETRHLLPGLDEIYTMIDLPNIRRFDNEPISFRDCKIEGQKGWSQTDVNKIPAEWLAPYRKMTGTVAGHEDIYLSGEERKLKPEYTPAMMTLGIQILRTIYTNVSQDLEKQQQKQEQQQEDQQDGDAGGQIIMVVGSLDDLRDANGLLNHDTPPTGPSKKSQQVNLEKLEKEMTKVQEFLAGEAKKKKIAARAEHDVKALSAASATITNVGNEKIGHGRVLVTERMNESVYTAEWFPFGNRWDSTLTPSRSALDDFAQGVRMGQILAKRLQVRNEQTITKYPRQPKGNIDRRFLAQLGADQYNVFKRSYMEQYRPALLHLSLDGSGSMIGNTWKQALILATALAYAATKISNLDVTISVRGDVITDHGLALLATIYDSRRDTFAVWRKWGPLISPNGSTPEGLCYEAELEQLMDDAKKYEVYFVNISDGLPNFWATPAGGTRGRRSRWGISNGIPAEKGIVYSDQTAYTHTRQQVNLMRESGIKVLSYLAGAKDWRGYMDSGVAQAFRQMYGEDAVFIDPTEITGVTQTMNKLLTKKGA